jgi:hypothetical protein
LYYLACINSTLHIRRQFQLFDAAAELKTEAPEQGKFLPALPGPQDNKQPKREDL